jgi:N-acetyl-gamma-glutamyl-phosphate reductase
MRVEIPLHARVLDGVGGRAIHETLAVRYADEPFVRVAPLPGEGIDERYLDPQACNDTNAMVLHVLPNPAGHVLLAATLDNLGKGASGVAIQNLNLMLGLGERTGLSA